MNHAELAGHSKNWISNDPILFGILCFFVAHLSIRLFGTSNFSVDETMTAIHTQRFHLVYLLRNPPMFDWLYFGLSRVIGGGLFTMQLLKTALVAGGAVFFYLAIKPHFLHRSALAAAVASYGATVFYGWELLQIYSHTNALVFALGFTFWAFMRVVDKRCTIDYALLGVGLGIGLLSKYLFGLFFLSLVIAALTTSRLRAAMVSWRFLLTLTIGLLVLSPLLYGLSGSVAAAWSAIGERVEGPERAVWLPLADFFIQSAQFWLPFGAILGAGLAFWPAASQIGVAADCDNGAANGDDSLYLLLRNATLVATAAVFLSVIIFGTRITAGHYLVPVLSLLPAAALSHLDRRQLFPEVAVRKFLQGAFVLIAGIALVRFLFFLFVSPPFCVPRCILFVDYTPVVEMLDRSDGRQNVILSDDIHIASNLLRALMDSRVIVPTEAGGLGVGVASSEQRNCDFVWFRDYRGQGERSLESALKKLLRRAPTASELADIGPATYLKSEWQTKLLWDWGPETIIGIAPIKSNSVLCEGRQVPAQLTLRSGEL